MSEQYYLEYTGQIPSVNHYWGRTKFGGLYVTKAGKEFKEIIKLTCLSKKFTPLSTSLSMKIVVQFNRKRDIDNFLKPLLDAMQGICYENDNQIDELIINKSVKSKTNWFSITITEKT